MPINHESWKSALDSVVTDLERTSIDYTLLAASTFFVQGVDVPLPSELDFSIQWDLFPRALELFVPSIQFQPGQDSFTFERHGLSIHVRCYYNTVVATDPDRLAIVYEGRPIQVKSLDYYLRTLSADDPLYAAIKRHLQALQAHNSALNAFSWNQDAYDAWVARFGLPVEAAKRIRRDPHARFGSLLSNLGDPNGLHIINLLGSHGSKAIALALLGAHVTVVDIAPENARYAQEVAAAAAVPLRYLISDVLTLPSAELNASYDLVLLELGILHYFVDLEPLMSIILRLLRPGGRLLLHDFHPITAKLISSKGKKHKVSGNYFDKTIVTASVAHSKHLQAREPHRVYLRQWTLGEIVTAVAAAGLHITLLEEKPNSKIDDIGLPKLFTIMAEKL